MSLIDWIAICNSNGVLFQSSCWSSVCVLVFISRIVRCYHGLYLCCKNSFIFFFLLFFPGQKFTLCYCYSIHVICWLYCYHPFQFVFTLSRLSLSSLYHNSSAYFILSHLANFKFFNYYLNWILILFLPVTFYNLLVLLHLYYIASFLSCLIDSFSFNH